MSIQESEYLIEQLKAPSFDIIKRVRLDKDGTYYDLIMMHTEDGISCGIIGFNSPCWLVISGINGKVYTFSEQSYLSWDYVYEKLGRALELGETDCKNLTIAINAVRNQYMKTH